MAQGSRDDRERTPQTIGKYRIESTLGHGAMGVVYKACDTSIDRLVALKTIRSDLLIDDVDGHWLERFQREARAAARCLHPNIVTIFEYGDDDGIPYICMEYVDGKQLQDYMRGRDRIDVADCVKIIEQVLKALGYAHAQGIVHRDIKPGNIMLLEGGQVKVTDFGIARLDSITITEHGSTVGTPSYMSPEQFIGGDIDRRSDIFSTGVILYELLVGQKPFPGKSMTEVMYAVLNKAPQDPIDINADLSAALGPVLLKALARQPEDRYQTAAAFFSSLSIAATGQATILEESGISDGATIVAPALQAARTARSTDLEAGGKSGSLDETMMTKVETDLTVFLGPVARIMVRKAAANAASVSELYESLAGHIASSSDRAAFLRKATEPVSGGGGTRTNTRTSTGTGSSSGRRRRDLRSMFGTISSATMAGRTSGSRSGNTHSPSLAETTAEDFRERARTDLTEFLGPIAQILVRKASAKTSSPSELYRLLSEHITNADDRALFLRRAPPG